jgi:hypothetical protein
MINMGCITVSLIGLLIAVGFWKRKGSGIETQSGVIPRLYSTPPSPWRGPAFYPLLRAIKMNEKSTMTLQVRTSGSKGSVPGSAPVFVASRRFKVKLKKA